MSGSRPRTRIELDELCRCAGLQPPWRAARKYDQLAELKDDTVRKLDDVISDGALKDKQPDAKSYKNDVSRRWDTIERIFRPLVLRQAIRRGGGHGGHRWTCSQLAQI